MQSLKITTSEAGQRRWYDDACGAALAMELLGERWSLLIVRELMFGPRRFGEIRAALRGISANVLTQRLEGLERMHIVRREKLPPPANVQVYGLTSWGYRAEEAIKALFDWAVRSPDHDRTLPVTPASILLSMRTLFDVERAKALPPFDLGFTFGAESFVAHVAGGALPFVRGSGRSDVHFATSARMLANIIYGKLPITAAEAAGELVFSGDRDLAQRFIDLFSLPPTAEVE